MRHFKRSKHNPHNTPAILTTAMQARPLSVSSYCKLGRRRAEGMVALVPLFGSARLACPLGQWRQSPQGHLFTSATLIGSSPSGSRTCPVLHEHLQPFLLAGSERPALHVLRLKVLNAPVTLRDDWLRDDWAGWRGCLCLPVPCGRRQNDDTAAGTEMKSGVFCVLSSHQLSLHKVFPAANKQNADQQGRPTSMKHEGSARNHERKRSSAQ